MNKRNTFFILTLIAVLSFTACSKNDESLVNKAKWGRAASVKEGFTKAKHFIIDKKLYTIDNRMYSYDFEKDRWALVNRLFPYYPADFSRTMTFSINGKGYMGGGEAYDERKLIYEFNPVDSSWTRKKDFPGPERYGAGVSFAIGSKGYLIGGVRMEWGTALNLCMNDVWEYNPVNDTWIQKKDFPGEGRSNAVSFSMNGKGYILTGTYPYKYKGDLSMTVFLKDVWEYTPETDTWKRLTDLPGDARAYASGGGSNNVIYVGGGWGENRELGDYWMLDLKTGVWKQLESMNKNTRYNALGFSYGGAFYVTAGIIGGEEPEDDLTGEFVWKYSD